MSRRWAARLSWPEQALLAVLAAWTLLPVALMVVHSLASGDRLTGADGPIGADQLQYLAWVRDSGRHLLASNLFDLAPSAHAYLQPMFAISGGLWRLGVPLPLAYLLWKPVAIVVLFAGAAAWAAWSFPTRARERIAVLALTLFFYGPAAWIADWGGLGSSGARAHLFEVAGETFPAGQLWGYLPTAISIGLMPTVLLATERANARGRRRGAVVIASSGALLISWLHPWEGLTLLLVLLGLGAWNRRGDWRGYAAPVIFGALPFAYYGALGHYDSAWHEASARELVPRPPIASVLLILVPLLVLASAGLGRARQDPSRRAVLLWIPAAFVTYCALGTFPAHALEALSLPLAVLAVDGWSALRLPALAGAAALAIATLPGMADAARGFHRVAAALPQEYYLRSSEARALDWVNRHDPSGGVLAPPLFALAVPSQTGHPVWVGHQFWSRDYVARAEAAEALFAGSLAPAQARSLVRSSGARLLIGDCGSHRDLAGVLAPLLVSAHRFGCTIVYVVRPGRHGSAGPA